jgi:hypothetical protein
MIYSLIANKPGSDVYHCGHLEQSFGDDHKLLLYIDRDRLIEEWAALLAFEPEWGESGYEITISIVDGEHYDYCGPGTTFVNSNTKISKEFGALKIEADKLKDIIIKERRESRAKLIEQREKELHDEEVAREKELMMELIEKYKND